jgi:amino acid transporter
MGNPSRSDLPLVAVASSFSDAVKRLLVGRPFRSEDRRAPALKKRIAMPVFASDMLSSVAYAPDEILLALSLTSLVALTVAPWIGVAVGIVILVIVACYRINVKAYPSGGGDYEVASKNLGSGAGLIVAAALLVDYVLTLAVSMTVFAAYITTAFPMLAPYRVPVAIVGILLICFAGLRGSRATPMLLAVPTYLFLGAVFLTMSVGLIRVGLGDTPQAQTADYTVVHSNIGDQATLGLATVLIVLRAFSSGAVALAGVQTVATAVPAFKKPRGKNAGNTLLLSGLLAALMLTGLTYLASVTGIKYVDDPHLYLVRGDGSPVSAEYEQEPVLAQLAHAIFDNAPVMFFIVVLITALVLLAAANTAVEGFPGLASRLARDEFLPRQLATKGDRLTFSQRHPAAGRGGDRSRHRHIRLGDGAHPALPRRGLRQLRPRPSGNGPALAQTAASGHRFEGPDADALQSGRQRRRLRARRRRPHRRHRLEVPRRRLAGRRQPWPVSTSSWAPSTATIRAWPASSLPTRT